MMSRLPLRRLTSILFTHTPQPHLHRSQISLRFLVEPAQVRASSQTSSTLPHHSEKFLPRAHPSYHIPHRQSPRWRYANQTSAKSSPSLENRTLTSESRGAARLLISYHDLERALERRGLNTVRVLIVGAGLTAIIVGLSWPSIKQWGAVEGAEVAAASLEHEQLQNKASAMVHEVLKDPKTAEQVEQMLKTAVVNLFQDQEFTDHAVVWTTRVLQDALTWESLQAQGVEYLKGVFRDEESQQAATESLAVAVENVVKDQELQDHIASVSFRGYNFCHFLMLFGLSCY